MLLTTFLVTFFVLVALTGLSAADAMCPALLATILLACCCCIGWLPTQFKEEEEEVRGAKLDEVSCGKSGLGVAAVLDWGGSEAEVQLRARTGSTGTLETVAVRCFARHLDGWRGVCERRGIAVSVFFSSLSAGVPC